MAMRVRHLVSDKEYENSYVIYTLDGWDAEPDRDSRSNGCIKRFAVNRLLPERGLSDILIE